MAQVRDIVITRAEGPTSLCNKPKHFNNFYSATAWLNSESDTFPKTGGYDKHDFTVVFTDGETYSGRLDCKHRDCDNNDLDIRQHMIDLAEWMSGRTKAPYCGMTKYKEFLSHYDDDTKREYARLLDNYLYFKGVGA